MTDFTNSSLTRMGAAVLTWALLMSATSAASDAQPPSQLAHGAQGASGASNRVRLSPREVKSFQFGGVTATIDYSRPFKKGRQIWGGLLRWNAWWMPGADEVTTLKCDSPILARTLSVPAGTFSLYMSVDKYQPQLIWNSQLGQEHVIYHSSRDLGRVDLDLVVREIPVEQLTLSIEAIGPDAGLLKLAWDDREYSLPLKVAR